MQNVWNVTDVPEFPVYVALNCVKRVVTVPLCPSKL